MENVSKWPPAMLDGKRKEKSRLRCLLTDQGNGIKAEPPHGIQPALPLIIKRPRADSLMLISLPETAAPRG